MTPREIISFPYRVDVDGLDRSSSFIAPVLTPYHAPVRPEEDEHRDCGGSGETEGKFDQMKANLTDAGEKVKDAFKE